MDVVAIFLGERSGNGSELFDIRKLDFVAFEGIYSRS